MICMENLVEAVPTRMDLEGIREKYKNGDGQLANGNEKRRGGVHGYDISAYFGTESQISKNCDDFVGHCGRAYGGCYDDVHALLGISRHLIEDGEEVL